MNECSGCGEQIESINPWCDICSLLVPEIIGYKLEKIPDGKEANRLREVLGNPSRNIKDVWNSLKRISLDDSSWALKKDMNSSQRRDFEFNTMNADSPEMFSKDDEEIFTKGPDNKYKKEKRNDLIRLQKGIILPDGSHLSWISGEFFLDGENIDLPYKDLREMLDKNPVDDEYNWKVLLFSISLASENIAPKKNPTNLQHAYQIAAFYGENKSDKNIINHPIKNLKKGQKNRIYGFIKDQVEGELQEKNDYPFINYMGENPLKTQIWVDNWNRVIENPSWDMESRLIKKYNTTISLMIHKGRLMLRVRRNDTWRKIRVPRDLKIWAILINWSMGTPGTRNRMKMECFQYHMFCNPEKKIISKTEINGINFLKGILDISKGKASCGKNNKSFQIRGDSGMSYRVIPGRGPHGSRFRVMVKVNRPKLREEIQQRHHDGRRQNLKDHIPDEKELCIVEEPTLRKLVIGDAIGSIIMALLNDNKSRKDINTLDKYITKFERMELARVEGREYNEEIRDPLERIEYEDEIRHHIRRIEQNLLEHRISINNLTDELQRYREQLTNLLRDFDDRPQA